jgi:hypothetical protein
MKTILSITFLVCLFGCKQPNRASKNAAHDADVFDESNYKLVSVDSFQNKISTKYYINKYDPSWRREVQYWDNGKLMAKAYSHNGKVNGWFVTYDMYGKLMALDSFSDGNIVLRKINGPEDTSGKFFINGKLVPLINTDSLH